jgi:RND superfamily putative drug exporter
MVEVLTASNPASDDGPRSRGLLRRFAPWLVIAGWLVVVAAAFPLATKLSSVTTDRVVDYLPASAESTRVAGIEDKLPGGSNSDFLIVYHRAAGVTDADTAAAERHLADLTKRYPPKPAPADAASGPGVLRSSDGKALMIPLSVADSYGSSSTVIDEVRRAVKDHPGGLEVRVTGPAAIDADMDKTFDGADTTLLVTTVIVVAVLLVLTYRSPVLWLIPLVVVGCAAVLSMATVYLLAKWFGVVVNDQNSALLTILVFGVGTDYALLIIARYREELRHRSDVREAMLVAVRRAGPSIVASAATVTAGLLCMLVADMNNTRGLGPVGAAGILCTLVTMLTLFPALLMVCGRGVFWPVKPGPAAAHATAGFWPRIAALVDRYRVATVLGSLAVLGALAIGLTGQTNPLRQQDQFINTPESVTGFTLLTSHFRELGGQPVTILTRPTQVNQVTDVVKATPGVTRVEPGRTSADWAEVIAFPTDAPDTPKEQSTVRRLRTAVHNVPGAEGIVGGLSAQNLDTDFYSQRDQKKIIPMVLVVILVILGLLLGSIAAPIMLIATVVLSFAAALGGSIFAFEHIFGFKGLDYTVPILGFVFLVALGVDYNIFLMHRVREESRKLGTRKGVLKGLSVTGGVITSAALVLAATFAVLSMLPLVLMVQLGFLVAFGVLLDAFVVRSALVPALSLILGRRIWWPGPLSRKPAAAEHPAAEYPGTVRPAADRPAAEHPGTDRPAVDRPAVAAEPAPDEAVEMLAELLHRVREIERILGAGKDRAAHLTVADSAATQHLANPGNGHRPPSDETVRIPASR